MNIFLFMLLYMSVANTEQTAKTVREVRLVLYSFPFALFLVGDHDLLMTT